MTGRVVSSDATAPDDTVPSQPTKSAKPAKASRRVVGRTATAGAGKTEAAATPDAAKASQPVKHRSARSVASQSATSSQPGAFVDARDLQSDQAVPDRIESSQSAGPLRRPKVIEFKARGKEERKAQAIAIALRVGIVALVAAVLSAIVWLLFFSPVLKLEASQITVSGANEWVSAEEVAAVAEQQVGRSLLIVSTGSIAQELKAMPGVTSAEVSRQWPHGVAISVAAQKPAAVLRSADGALTAVDSQARVLNAVGASVEGIPVVDVDSVEAGLESKAVQQSLEILASLPESWRQSITKVTAKTQDSVTTELNNGQVTIVWGDASQLALKKAEVDKIINDPAVIGDKHQVNVSSPKKPIIK